MSNSTTRSNGTEEDVYQIGENRVFASKKTTTTTKSSSSTNPFDNYWDEHVEEDKDWLIPNKCKRASIIYEDEEEADNKKQKQLPRLSSLSKLLLVPKALSSSFRKSKNAELEERFSGEREEEDDDDDDGEEEEKFDSWFEKRETDEPKSSGSLKKRLSNLVPFNRS